MTERAHAELRRFATVLINAFVSAVEERSRTTGSIGHHELESTARLIEGSPIFAKMVNSFYLRIVEEATKQFSRQQRRDPFKRLIVHPMGQAFEDQILSREILPGYFSFIHLVMGDEVTSLTERLQQVVDETRDGEDYDWDVLYNDTRAKVVLWTVLTRVADSFKRFDVRRDWFINLMQTRPQAVSLASNAFIPLHPPEDEKAPIFGGREFVLMFECLLAPTRDLPSSDRVAFLNAFSTTPEAVFGALWRQIDTAKQ